MILGLMALGIVIMLAFPETPAARWLHAVTVDKPLAWLSSLKRRDVIFLFVMVALLLSAGEFIAVFGIGELFAIGVNLSFYFDAIIVTTSVTIAAAAATAWRDVHARLLKWRGASMQRRTRAVRRRETRKTRQPKSPDDKGAPGWDLVYAV